jgi:shikimate kinase
MFPKDNDCPIDIERFPQLLGVIDAIYNPLRTVFIRTAKKKGIPAEGGLYMLVSQAVRAYEYFFGVTPDASLTERVYSEILREKQNVVLIGMPSCGKTSIGKKLCELTGAKMIDTDEEITKKSGMPIPEIFQKYGEKHFRDLESEVIRELSSGVTGTVISTGGGAILRNENVDLLRANGNFDVRLSRPTPNTQLGTTNSSSLRARVDEANSWGADYFISIHTNASTSSSVNGTEVLVYSSPSVSSELAENILREVTNITGLRNRGVKLRPGLYVLRKTNMTAVLVELGFISNTRDANLMANEPGLFAEGIYQGILDFLSLS